MPRQEKLSLFGQFRPTGVDASATEKLRAMAGLTSQIGEEIFQRGAKIRQKQGALAGAQSVKRDKEGKIQAPTMERDTIFGESFNQAAIMAHKSQIKMNNRKELDRLQNDHALDPKAFTKAATALKQGSMKGMPPEIANEVAADMDVSISNRGAKLTESLFKRESENQRATALESIETLQDDILNFTRSGDLTAQADKIVEASEDLDRWVATGVISASEAVDIKERTLESMRKQEALRDIETIIFDKSLTSEQQLEKGFDFVNKLKKTTLKDLNPDQRDSVVSVVESKLNGLISQSRSADNQRNIEREKVISDLKISAGRVVDAAKNGEQTEGNLSKITEETELLHSDGHIKEAERTSILTKVAQAQDELNRMSLADKRIVSKLAGDSAIVSSQSDLDSYWKRNVQDDVTASPVDLAIVKTADFIGRTRMVPTKVKQQIQNNIFSGNPELIKQSADLIDRLDEIPGMNEAVVDANQRAFINQVVALKDSLVPEEAIRIAKEMTNPNDKDRVERRKSELSEMKKGWSSIDFKSEINDVFEVTTGEFLTDPLSGFIGADKLNPITSDKAAKEYQTLFEAYYVAGMDKGEAKDEAAKVMKANWKDSQFGIMKHPPEYFYNVEGKSEYIKDQLLSELTAGTIGLDIDKDNIFLVSDERTDREASGGSPSYRIFYQNEDGSLSFPHLTDPNGKPSNRWMPDAQAERARQKLEGEALKKKIRSKNVEQQKTRERILKSRFGL